MNVFLVRHAIAESTDPERWPDDLMRPLSPDGIARFRSVAKALRQVATPQLVLSSPASRCTRTAEILTDRAGWPQHEIDDQLAPGSRAQDVSALLRSRGSDSVAVIGHEPDLGDLVSYLISGGQVRTDLRKGGFVWLEGEPTRRGALLRAFSPPRLLIGR
jgi:phosphohistidine phosphatase